MTLEKRSTLLTKKKKKGTKHSQEDRYTSKDRNEKMQPISGLASG